MQPAWVLGLLALASCDAVYGLRGRDATVGDDTAPLDAPPDGLVICSYEGDTPLGDDDQDGISNQSDLCPSLYDRGHNEDGDCAGDLCDLCPQSMDDSPDGDGDGIGDVCDLPGSSQDERRFEAFDNPDEIIPLDPSWVLNVNTGTLARPPSVGAAPLYAWMNTEIAPPFLIETQLRTQATGDYVVGIAFGVDDTDQTPNGWLVGIAQLGGMVRLRLFSLANGVMNAQNEDRDIVVEPVQGLRILVSGSTITVATGSSGAVITTLTVPGVVTLGSFGLGIQGDSGVTFDYFYEVHHR